jgi:hypothetical protein
MSPVVRCVLPPFGTAPRWSVATIAASVKWAYRPVVTVAVVRIDPGWVNLAQLSTVRTVIRRISISRSMDCRSRYSASSRSFAGRTSSR